VLHLLAGAGLGVEAGHCLWHDLGQRPRVVAASADRWPPTGSRQSRRRKKRDLENGRDQARFMISGMINFGQALIARAGCRRQQSGHLLNLD
jgi:hypothetical protein